MRMNVCLVQISQFLKSFCLIVWYKPNKKHVVSDTLNRLASANSNLPNLDPHYSKLDVLFAYFIMLVKMKPFLLKSIVQGYQIDNR